VALDGSPRVGAAEPEATRDAAKCIPITGAKTRAIISTTTPATLWSRRAAGARALAGRNRFKRVMAYLRSDQPPRAGQGQARSGEHPARSPGQHGPARATVSAAEAISRAASSFMVAAAFSASISSLVPRRIDTLASLVISIRSGPERARVERALQLSPDQHQIGFASDSRRAFARSPCSFSSVSSPPSRACPAASCATEPGCSTRNRTSSLPAALSKMN
jgi:hypothetical protein